MNKSRVARALALTLFLLPAAAMAQVSDIYIIPAISDQPGALGTRWVTSFQVFNPQPYELVVTLTFVPQGGGEATTGGIELPANSTAAWDNLLADGFELPERAGSLIVSVDPENNAGVQDDIAARAVVVQSRTFNNSSNGTYGQGIDGAMTGLLDVELDNGLTAIATGVQNGANTGFRTNVGALNLGRSSVTMMVVGYDVDGNEVGRAPFILPPTGHAQDRLPVNGSDLTIEFWVEDPLPDASDFVFPYASVVDDRSGDATYLDPKLLALPGALFKGAQASSANRTITPISHEAIRPILRGAHRLARFGPAVTR